MALGQKKHRNYHQNMEPTTVKKNTDSANCHNYIIIYSMSQETLQNQFMHEIYMVINTHTHSFEE